MHRYSAGDVFTLESWLFEISLCAIGGFLISFALPSVTVWRGALAGMGVWFLVYGTWRPTGGGIITK